MAQPVLPTVTRVAAHRMLIPPNLSIKDEKHVYSLYNYRFCIFELNISLVQIDSIISILCDLDCICLSQVCISQYIVIFQSVQLC